MLPDAQLVVRSIVTLAGPGPLLATGSTADTHWLSPFASVFGPLQSLRCRKNIVNSWKRRGHPPDHSGAAALPLWRGLTAWQRQPA